MAEAFRVTWSKRKYVTEMNWQWRDSENAEQGLGLYLVDSPGSNYDINSVLETKSATIENYFLYLET